MCELILRLFVHQYNQQPTNQKPLSNDRWINLNDRNVLIDLYDSGKSLYNSTTDHLSQSNITGCHIVCRRSFRPSLVFFVAVGLAYGILWTYALVRLPRGATRRVCS